MPRPKKGRLGMASLDPLVKQQIIAELGATSGLTAKKLTALLPYLIDAIGFARVPAKRWHIKRGIRDPKKAPQYTLFADVMHAFTTSGIKITLWCNEVLQTESPFLTVLRACIKIAGLPPITALKQAYQRAPLPTR
jgi:hypothetical protein